MQTQDALSNCCTIRPSLPGKYAIFMCLMGTLELSVATTKVTVSDTFVAFATLEDSVIVTPDSVPDSHGMNADKVNRRTATAKRVGNSKHDIP